MRTYSSPGASEVFFASHSGFCAKDWGYPVLQDRSAFIYRSVVRSRRRPRDFRPGHKKQISLPVEEDLTIFLQGHRNTEFPPRPFLCLPINKLIFFSRQIKIKFTHSEGFQGPAFDHPPPAICEGDRRVWRSNDFLRLTSDPPSPRDRWVFWKQVWGGITGPHLEGHFENREISNLFLAFRPDDKKSAECLLFPPKSTMLIPKKSAGTAIKPQFYSVTL